MRKPQPQTDHLSLHVISVWDGGYARQSILFSKKKDTEETRQFRRQHIVLKCRYIKLPGNPDSPFSYKNR